jgi:hypothetical protein
MNFNAWLGESAAKSLLRYRECIYEKALENSLTR